MKVRFYPRDIGMFRTEEFDFSDRGIYNITLEVKHKKDYKDFHDRAELIEWIRAYGIISNDVKYPIEFNKRAELHPYLGNVYNVTQSILVGWMKEL